MHTTAETIGRERIAQVVDTFYERVQRDPGLAMPFSVVKDWPHHKDLITHFWWVTLGGERYMDYSYNVVKKHRAVGFTSGLLKHNWLPLFEQTLREQLPTDLADAWMAQAQRIGRSLDMNHQFWVEQQNSGDAPLAQENEFTQIRLDKPTEPL